MTAVEGSGVERKLAIWAVGVDPIGIEQAAIEQKAVGANLQKMGAAGNLPGRAMERDSQPTPSRRSRDWHYPNPGQIGCVLAVFPFSSLNRPVSQSCSRAVGHGSVSLDSSDVTSLHHARNPPSHQADPAIYRQAQQFTGRTQVQLYLTEGALCLARFEMVDRRRFEGNS